MKFLEKAIKDVKQGMDVNVFDDKYKNDQSYDESDFYLLENMTSKVRKKNILTTWMKTQKR